MKFSHPCRRVAPRLSHPRGTGSGTMVAERAVSARFLRPPVARRRHGKERAREGSGRKRKEAVRGMGPGPAVRMYLQRRLRKSRLRHMPVSDPPPRGARRRRLAAAARERRGAAAGVFPPYLRVLPLRRWGGGPRARNLVRLRFSCRTNGFQRPVNLLSLHGSRSSAEVVRRAAWRYCRPARAGCLDDVRGLCPRVGGRMRGPPPRPRLRHFRWAGK